MNNDMNDTELENLLRGLSPAAASPALARRVDEELKLEMSWLSSTSRRKPHQAPRWLTSAGWAAMGAAAAIAIMSNLPQETRTQGLATVSAAKPAALPAAATIREWDDTRDNSSHYGRNRMTEKRSLVVSSELGTWVDPRYSSAQMSVEIPSQRQLLQPISFR